MVVLVSCNTTATCHDPGRQASKQARKEGRKEGRKERTYALKDHIHIRDAAATSKEVAVTAQLGELSAIQRVNLRAGGAKDAK